MNKNKGTTLLEVIAVILLLTLISTVEITKFSMERSKAQDKINTLYSDILYIRELSMNGNRKARIRIDTETNSYYLKLGDDLSEEKISLSPMILKGFTNEHKTIQFLQSGVPSFAGTINVELKSLLKVEKYNIVIYPATGNIVLEMVE